MTHRPRPDAVLKPLIWWLTFLLVFAWLPLLRALFDGSTYQWGESHFGVMFRAAGFQLASWVLVVKTVLYATLLWLALRRRGPRFAWLLVGWTAFALVDTLVGFVADPSGFEFHGDTLGIHLNLGPFVLILFAVLFALSLYWTLRRAPAEPLDVPWTARNRRLSTIMILLLPVQFVLLRFGDPHGTTDAIGVLLTIAQCPLFTLAIWPWETRRE